MLSKQKAKIFLNLIKFKLLIFCLTIISNDQDFFIKINDWQQQKRINLEVQVLKEFDQPKQIEKRKRFS